MEIQDFLSILTSIGIGGIIGAYIQNLLSKKTQIESEIRQLNESKYRTILVWMRCVLNPEKASLFTFEGKGIPDTMTTDEIQKLAKAKVIEFYYNTLLYGSDEVLFSLKGFIQNPDEKKFTETAVAMRKELWKIHKIPDTELYSIQ